MGIITLTPWKNLDTEPANVFFESYSDKKCASVNGSAPVANGKTLFSSDSCILASQPIFNKNGLLIRSTPQTKLVAHKTLGKKRHISLAIPEALFISASESIQDPFWKVIIRGAAAGKWPRGFKYRNNTLLYQHKNKILECPISLSAPPEDVGATLVAFIQKHSGIQSDSDRQRDHETLRARVTAPAVQKKPGSPWTLVRARPYYLSGFVQKQTAQFRLSASERLQLVQVINYGLLMKWITKKNIVFDASKQIASIDGLTFDPVTRTFMCERSEAPVPLKARKEKAAAVSQAEALLEHVPEEQRITLPRVLSESACVGLVDLIKSIKAHSKYTVYEDMAAAPSTTTEHTGPLSSA